MLPTFKHELNILDATDGFICEALMIELEKAEIGDVEIEIEVEYSAGRPAKMFERNGDPGHDVEHEEIETEKEADDYAWEIIKNLCVNLNGLPIKVTLAHGDEIAYKMLEGLRVNIQNFIDQDLPDLIESNLEERDDE
jgi:hypothetical protein